MTEEHYDHCFDAITEFLGEVNDERWRLLKAPAKDNQGDY